jgi:hypothetical protein
LKEDRVDASQVVQYLTELLATEQRVGDPIEEIQSIFNKVLAWKTKMGDQFVQSQEVSKKLRSNVKMHNIKSLRRLLGSL